MTIELLNIDCMEYMATQPDNAFDLIIADPPYFEIKGEFDYAWNSFNSYLMDVERWGKEIARVLSEAGTLYWWGDDKRIAYTQTILDKHLNLENSIVWYKENLRGGMFGSAGGDNIRSFPICTERALVYSKEINRTGLEAIKLDTNNFKCLRNYFELLQRYIGKGLKKINDQLGHRKAEHAFYWGSTQWDLPTSETYEEIRKAYNCDEWEGWREYEELRNEYEELRRPFNNNLNLTEVLIFDQPMTGPQKSSHPTPKAPKVTEALVRTSGKKGGAAFIPFMGGGTEVIECHKFGMRVTGCEIDTDYYNAATERFDRETRQVAMF